MSRRPIKRTLRVGTRYLWMANYYSALQSAEITSRNHRSR